MTEQECELITIIRECHDQVKALEVAVETIISYLQQLESSESTSVACLQEQA
jgi:hypothetical protein